MGIISDLKDTLNPVTGISKAIFGDKGIAGGIMDTLKSVGVIKDTEAEERARQALNEYDVKVKEFENEKAKIINEKLRIINDNVKDARNMQVVALQQSDLFSKRFLYLMTAFILLSSFTYIGFITFTKIPADNIRYVDTILGFMLGTLITTLIGFHYGGSAGSEKKNDVIKQTISELLKK